MVFSNGPMASEEGPWLKVIDFIIVFFLSSSFGFLKHKLREYVTHRKQEALMSVVDALFEELMILGIISLLLALVNDMGWSTTISKAAGINGQHADPVAESLHSIHMFIFFIMVMFIVQMLCLVWVGLRMAKRWKEWEDVGTMSDTGDIKEKLWEWKGRKNKENVTHNNNKAHIWTWPWRNRGIRGFLLWRAIRHEFLFPSTWSKPTGYLFLLNAMRDRVYIVKHPYCFPLHKYFFRRLSKLFENMVRVTFPTYLICFISAPVFVAVNGIGIQNQLYLLVSLAWLLVLLLYLFGVNVHWIQSRLCPRLPEDYNGLLTAFDDMTSVTHRTIRVATKVQTLRRIGVRKNINTNEMGSSHSGFSSYPSLDVGITPAKQDWSQEPHSGDTFQCHQHPKHHCETDYSPFGAPSFRLDGVSHRSLIKGGPKLLTWFLEAFLFAQAIVMSFLVLFLIYFVEHAHEIVLLVFGCSGIVFNLVWLIPKITQAVVVVLSVEHMKDKSLIDDIELETREERRKEQLMALKQVRDAVWCRHEHRHLQPLSMDCSDVPEAHEGSMKSTLINPKALKRMNTLSEQDNRELQSAFTKSSTNGFVLKHNVDVVLENLGIKDEDTCATLKRILANYGNRLSVHDFDEALARLGEEEEACLASSKMDQALFEYLCDRETGSISVNNVEEKFLACGIVAPHPYFAEESVREAFGELKAHLTRDEFLIWCRFHEL